VAFVRTGHHGRRVNGAETGRFEDAGHPSVDLPAAHQQKRRPAGARPRPVAQPGPGRPGRQVAGDRFAGRLYRERRERGRRRRVRAGDRPDPPVRVRVGVSARVEGPGDHRRAGASESPSAPRAARRSWRSGTKTRGREALPRIARARARRRARRTSRGCCASGSSPRAARNSARCASRAHHLDAGPAAHRRARAQDHAQAHARNWTGRRRGLPRAMPTHAQERPPWLPGWRMRRRHAPRGPARTWSAAPARHCPITPRVGPRSTPWRMLDILTSRAIAGEAGEDLLRLDAPERSAGPTAWYSSSTSAGLGVTARATW